ncbi:MAG: AlpA family phage regulatory protein [Actinomycetota bacterium]
MAAKRVPELAGIAEVASILGLNSRQHAYNLTRRPDFPAPVQRLRATPVWRAADVRAWKRRAQRG